jgi:hypothetical protein
MLPLRWQQGVHCTTRCAAITICPHLPILSSSSSSSSSSALLQCSHAAAQRTSLQQQPGLSLAQQRSLTRHQRCLSSN